MRPVPPRQEPFSSHLIPTKGCLALCSTLPLVSTRTGNQGRRAAAVKSRRRNKNLSLSVCLPFRGVNLSTADQWAIKHSSLSPQEEGKESERRREDGGNKCKQTTASIFVRLGRGGHLSTHFRVQMHTLGNRGGIKKKQDYQEMNYFLPHPVCHHFTQQRINISCLFTCLITFCLSLSQQ